MHWAAIASTTPGQATWAAIASKIPARHKKRKMQWRYKKYK